MPAIMSSRIAAPVCLAFALCLLIACGGGLQGGSAGVAEPGTPAGTYNMTVTATPNPPTQPASISLTVN